jgi:hypothetical protein
LGKLIEDSAALDENDVKDLIGLSRTAVNDGTASKAEVDNLLKSAKTATELSKGLHEESGDVTEDEIAALLEQLGNDKELQLPTKLKSPEVPSESREYTNISPREPKVDDDSSEVAAILSQLGDEARLEQEFEDSDHESKFPSLSRLSFPSAPKADDLAEDDLSTRLANLKTFGPKTYTGTDRGHINVFVPSLSKTDDETIHWCGKTTFI